MTKKMKKHQIKTHWYYWFWGVATIAVVSGQLFIGSGYYNMSKSIDRLTGVFYTVIE
jgi:hypothetical protein|tara:strand:+ start:292 stop:462 length:171 start_codon:yes stop_codon:yes gene_type:complete